MAALLVVYFHAVLQIAHIGQSADPSPQLPLFGKSGVDVFFVLSGLLIWCSTQDKQQSIVAFYRKRLLRIAPLYWLLTITVATIAFAVPSALRSTRFEVNHVVASLLFIPWPNPASNGSLQDLMTPPIVPGWTLNFELFFYLLFGLALLAPRDLRLPVAAIVLGAVMAVMWFWAPYSEIAGFYDPGLIAEFILGLFLGRLLEARARVPVASAWLLLAAALELLVLLDWKGTGLHRFFLSGLPACMLLFALSELEAKECWPQFAWLVALGDATYSLYLTHIFVLAGLRMVLTRLGASIDTWPEQMAFVGVAMSLCVAIGLAVYRFVERPLGQVLRQAGVLGQRPAVVVALATRHGAR